MAPIRPTCPRSRAASSIGRCAGQATRLWICIRSTRPPYQATARASCAAPSSAGRGPDLVGDEHLVALAVQRVGEQPLGVAVHRGGVEQPDACRDRGADQLAVPARGRGGLEPPPGAQPDHRHADPAPAQAPVLHVRHPRLVRPQSLMPINDPGPTGLMRRAAGKPPAAPADDRVRAPCPAGRTAGTGPAATVPPLHECRRNRTRHGTAPRCSGTRRSSDGSADGRRGLRVLGGDCVRSRGLDGFRSGSVHGRRERLDT